MDPTQCREKLGNLMKDESLALNELSTLLDREHGFLEANDVVALDGAARDRELVRDGLPEETRADHDDSSCARTHDAIFARAWLTDERRVME